MKNTHVTSLLFILFAVAACQPVRPRLQVEEQVDKVKFTPSSEGVPLVDNEKASLADRAIQAHRELKAVYTGMDYERAEGLNIMNQYATTGGALISGGSAIVASKWLKDLERGARINALLADKMVGEVSYNQIYNDIMVKRQLSGKTGEINPFEIREQMKLTQFGFANEALEKEIAKQMNSAVRDARSSETFMARMKAVGPAVTAKLRDTKLAWTYLWRAPSTKTIGGVAEYPKPFARFGEGTKGAWQFMFGGANEASVLRVGKYALFAVAATSAVYGYKNYVEGRDKLKLFSENNDEGMTEFFTQTPEGTAALVAMSDDDFAKLAQENEQVARFTIELNQRLRAAGAVN